MTNERSLEDDQCHVCGDYCFSFPPVPWRTIGDVQACLSCFEAYKDSDDPVREHRSNHLYAELARAESEVDQLQSAIDELG